MSKPFLPGTFGLEATVKRFFFNTDIVKNSLENGARIKLREIGGKIRKIMQRSMKRPGKRLIKRSGLDYPPSEPGKPPHAHAESGAYASLKNILFAMNPDNMGVVIGPVKLNQVGTANGVTATGTVPALHEFGGTATIREKLVGQTWRTYGRRRPRPGQPTRRRVARYPKRPFAQPALEKYMPRIPEQFRGLVSTQ